MAVADIDTMKGERNRFVKLAFCRADLLFELDRDSFIVFAAGATDPLFGVMPEKLRNSSFIDLVSESDRDRFSALLNATGETDRIDDETVELNGPKGLKIQAVLAGYRAREYDNHFFVAVKILGAKDSAGDLMDQAAFSQAAALRIKELTDNEGQVTLVRIRKFSDLLGNLGASDRQGLTTAIGDVLKSYSLGGATAGRVDEESFGYAHTNDVDTEMVNREVEETAQKFLDDEQSLETNALTLDADGAGMTEDQVAKALTHTLNQFCSSNQKVTTTRLSDSLDELMSGTVETVKYIKEVTRDSAFDLVFMPICDLRLGMVHHFEALSRFRDPERARSTFEIITLAENLGLIKDFDFEVVQKTVRLIGEFKERGVVPPIAVNLSAISLSSAPFVEELHKFVDQTPGLAKRMKFELTESAEIEDLGEVNKVIQSFREKGYKFSLDDFGAGSASFDYLNALEVDVVKFDGPVVRRACASKRGHDLLSTMTKMCTTAGIETIGEMVEDKKIANQLFYCGIDYGQGWYFGKPDGDPFTFEENFPGK